MLTWEQAISLSLGFFCLFDFFQEECFFIGEQFFSLRGQADSPLNKGHNKLECVTYIYIYLRCYLTSVVYVVIASGYIVMTSWCAQPVPHPLGGYDGKVVIALPLVVSTLHDMPSQDSQEEDFF